ncbi:MAG: digeranylgeranylglycerophospholipid reductase [Calditrichia bacterium]
MGFTFKPDEKYDIIVVGAGPAGSMAAREAARLGAKVLLLEKDREVGTPVRCAEGVAKDAFEEHLGYPAKPEWIAATVTRFQVIAPDGTPVFVDIGEAGYVLHRRLFDYDLAMDAVNAGAVLLTRAEATGLLKENGKISGVRLNLDGEGVKVASDIVIAADGVESRVARWAGINSTIPLKDIDTCAQVTLANLPIQSNTCYFYFSNQFAPGGYAWVFPKGDKTANVGLGINGVEGKNRKPLDYLEEFVERYFPGSSVISSTCGAVPVNKTLSDIVLDGFMVVGDAAHQANPISGGGITSGMYAGKIAGQVAAQAIRAGKVSRKDLLPYVRQWHKRVGKSHQRFYRLKELIYRFDDDQFNRLAGEYLALPKEKQNLTQLFTLAVKSHPRLLVDVIRLFANF